MRFDEIARQDASEVRTADTSSFFSASSELDGTLKEQLENSSQFGFYRQSGKRLFDLILVITFAPLWGPIVLILAIVARLDGGPAFFGHKRVGYGGELFRCWKIRTMVPDAEARLVHFLAANHAAAAEWARDQKLSNDPRITIIGRLLRKSSLDELPQLLNVLIGQMSLVGPRPVTEEELERYGSGRLGYLSLRPGVTGLWQVRGRNEHLSYDERVKLDLDYAIGCSASLDISVLLKTVPAVLKLSGR